MDITFDDRQADETIKRLASYLSPRVLATEGARALNRGGRAAATAMNREIRKTINVRAADVRERIQLGRATPGRLQVDIKVDRRPLSLRSFGPRETRRGLRVRVLKGKALQTISRGFLVERWGAAPMIRAGAERFPIRGLFGPSVGSQADAAWETAQKRAVEVIEQRLVRGINRQVERANR